MCIRDSLAIPVHFDVLKLLGTADFIAALVSPPWRLASKAPNLPASAVIYRSAWLSAPSSIILFSKAPDLPDTTFTLIPVLAVNFS